MRPRDENDLDAVIDRAVREMLDVEPSPALRARVIARLEHPRSSFRWAWIAAPITAATVLVLALWIPSRHRPLVSRPVSLTAQIQPVRSSPPLLNASNGNASGQPRRGGNVVTDRLAAARAVAVPETPFQSTIAIRPLVDVTPIGIAGIEYDRVEAERTEVAPLAQLSAVTVGPLSPPDRRN
jgi:hypothetical protein